MDERDYELYVPRGEAGYGPIMETRYITLISWYNCYMGSRSEYKRYRLVIDRDGIQETRKCEVVWRDCYSDWHDAGEHEI